MKIDVEKVLKYRDCLSDEELLDGILDAAESESLAALEKELFEEFDRPEYTCQVFYSIDDGGYVGLCDQVPSLSVVYDTPEKALRWIKKLVAHHLEDVKKKGELE